MYVFARFALLCCALLAAPGASRAQLPSQPATQQAATVDVTMTVKVNEDDLDAAKKKALEQGERQAFYKALLKLAPTRARDVYRSLHDQNITRYITSLTIDKEMEKAAYYEVEVTYRFDKAMLEEAIGVHHGIAAVDQPPTGDGLLIIPSYDPGEDRVLLFERQNLWRAYLSNLALEVGQGVLVTPFGDPRDISLLNDEALLSSDREALEKMARRYGTRNVVIAHARSFLQGDKPVLEVSLRKAGGKPVEAEPMRYISRLPEDTLDFLLARAAREVALKLRDSAQDYSMFASDDANRKRALVIRAEYRFGQEWRRIESILENLPGKDALEIGAVAPRFAQVTLRYRGAEAMIHRALLTQGLEVDTTNPYWIVSLP